MDGSNTDGGVPRTLTVREAAGLLGMTAGGVRGAILRGHLHASKNAEGHLVIKSYDLGAYHLTGDCRHYPPECMTFGRRRVLHDYLETVTSA